MSTKIIWTNNQNSFKGEKNKGYSSKNMKQVTIIIIFSAWEK